MFQNIKMSSKEIIIVSKNTIKIEEIKEHVRELQQKYANFPNIYEI